MRISVRAIGLNFADVFAVLGLYEAAGAAPLTPGFEVSGTVEAIGGDVEQFSVGDRVWGLMRFGAYATVVNVGEDWCQKMDEDCSFEEAAAYGAQAFTAWYALCVLGGLPSDGGRPLAVTSERKVVLVHSAAGGVGLRVVEMVGKMGGEIVCTVGRQEKVEVLTNRGVERKRILVRGVDDVNGFEKAVRAVLGDGGVDVVVDSVMGNYFDAGFRLLNLGGRYAVMGTASLMPSGALGWRSVPTLLRLGLGYLQRPKLDLINAINENKTVSLFNVLYLFNEVHLMRTAFDQLRSMNLQKAMVGKTFPFEKACEALRFFQSGVSVGKIVLVVNEN